MHNDCCVDFCLDLSVKGMYKLASGASGRLLLNDLRVASRPLTARKRTDGTQFVLIYGE